MLHICTHTISEKRMLNIIIICNILPICNYLGELNNMLSFELLSIQTNKQAYATNDARFVNNT